MGTTSGPGAGIDAVIFDWGGTLTPWHEIDFTAQWSAYAEAYGDGDRGAAAATLAEALVKAEGEAWRRTRTDHASARLVDVVRAAGLDPSGDAHRRAVTAYLEFWEPHTYTDPDVVALFTALRERGIAIGVLSNTLWDRGYHEQVFARDGVLHLIDGAVYSSEIAWAKPHPEAFRAAMEAVGATEPGRCVYVGDRLFEDVWGPKEVGMRGVHIPHSAIPHWQRGHTDGEPDAVIERLSDLVDVVDAWR